MRERGHPEIARRVWEAQYDEWKRTRATGPVRNGGLFDEFFTPLKSRDELLLYRQHPLEGYLTAGRAGFTFPSERTGLRPGLAPRSGSAGG